jgi:hypothetical protein
MADNKTYINYDNSKNLKAEINPSFIVGLQQIYLRYITEFYDDVADISNLIKEFNESIQDPKSFQDKKRIFTPTESEIYTLYALIHLLKNYAHEQGLTKVEEVPIDKDKFKEITDKATENTKDPIEILKNITQEFTKLS